MMNGDSNCAKSICVGIILTNSENNRPPLPRQAEQHVLPHCSRPATPMDASVLTYLRSVCCYDLNVYDVQIWRGIGASSSSIIIIKIDTRTTNRKMTNVNSVNKRHYIWMNVQTVRKTKQTTLTQETKEQTNMETKKPNIWKETKKPWIIEGKPKTIKQKMVRKGHKLRNWQGKNITKERKCILSAGTLLHLWSTKSKNC